MKKLVLILASVLLLSCNQKDDCNCGDIIVLNKAQSGFSNQYLISVYCYEDILIPDLLNTNHDLKVGNCYDGNFIENLFSNGIQ
jgi:hypothetical protein